MPRPAPSPDAARRRQIPPSPQARSPSCKARHPAGCDSWGSRARGTAPAHAGPRSWGCRDWRFTTPRPSPDAPRRALASRPAPSAGGPPPPVVTPAARAGPVRPRGPKPPSGATDPLVSAGARCSRRQGLGLRTLCCGSVFSFRTLKQTEAFATFLKYL